MMLKLLIISLVIIFSVGSTEAKAKPKPIDGRILGGKNANIEDYPYQLAFIDENDEKPSFLACGAVLIHPKWALTSASCSNGFPLLSMITIKYNSTYLRNSESTNITKIIRHPKFNPREEDNNISILELVEPLTCQNCHPIPISRTDPRTGDEVVLTGWGSRGLGLAATNNRLMVVTIPVYNFETCKEYYENHSIIINDNIFCAGYQKGGKGFCFGDFGGPAVINGQLSGLMSFQEGCGKPNSPSGFTNLVKYVSWIEQITGIKTY